MLGDDDDDDAGEQMVMAVVMAVGIGAAPLLFVSLRLLFFLLCALPSP